MLDACTAPVQFLVCALADSFSVRSLAAGCPGAAAKNKLVRRGVKEVVKSIRKGAKGLCILAGDISPIDVISHIPVLCEDNDITYIYVPSKDALGASAATKRPTSCVLITVDDSFKYFDLYEEVLAEARALMPVF